MGQDPGEIRQDIERTREQMGDTVEALSYKADVKARAKDSITDRVDSVKSRVGLAGSKVSDATPSGEDVKQGARRAKGIAEENPLGLAIGAVAVGFIAGLAVGRRQGPRLSPIDRATQKLLEDSDGAKHGDSLQKAFLKKVDKELQKLRDDHGHEK